jgi:tetraacyldisaccharide 4'-kinase
MRVARPWAWPLVAPYWAALRTKDALWATGLAPIRSLRWPAVSVGSISAGGAGKTPVVIALAELLRAAGRNVDVLSRGYGREGAGAERVDLGLPAAARRFGDEPVLIAQRTGVPVWVGANRYKAGMLAESSASETAGIHLLDDGFQHRQLARTFDVVLLTTEDLEDSLLPAGNRREPLGALRRADAVVVREEEAAQLRPRLQRLLRPGTGLWVIRRSLRVPERLAAASGPLVAFCGIARPEGFFEMLRRGGLSLTAEIAFPDHHRYTPGDVSRIVQSCLIEDCGFITTEKDAVKLEPELREKFESAGTLHVARLDAAFLEPEVVIRTLEARLG